MRSIPIDSSYLNALLRDLSPPNALALEVSLHTGLRIGDVLTLRTAQIKRTARPTVIEDKTGKHRRVYINTTIRARLLAQAGEVWIFPGRNPERHRTRQAVWRDLKRHAKAFGVADGISPHSMRKTYAARLLAKGYKVGRISKILAHDSIATTLLYISIYNF